MKIQRVASLLAALLGIVLFNSVPTAAYKEMRVEDFKNETFTQFLDHFTPKDHNLTFE